MDSATKKYCAEALTTRGWVFGARVLIMDALNALSGLSARCVDADEDEAQLFQEKGP